MIRFSILALLFVLALPFNDSAVGQNQNTEPHNTKIDNLKKVDPLIRQIVHGIDIARIEVLKMLSNRKPSRTVGRYRIDENWQLFDRKKTIIGVHGIDKPDLRIRR